MLMIDANVDDAEDDAEDGGDGDGHPLWTMFNRSPQWVWNLGRTSMQSSSANHYNHYHNHITIIRPMYKS